MKNSKPEQCIPNSTQRRKDTKAQEFWTALAERSGDSAFAGRAAFDRLTASRQKRRGASLPAAVQKVLAAPLRLGALALKVFCVVPAKTALVTFFLLLAGANLFAQPPPRVA